MGDLKNDLANFGELIETHISWVFIGDRTVIKVKKPVSLGFLDFSTMDKRRKACEQEFELNQRLSKGVYQGVVPITLDPDGVHRVEGKGVIVDYAVLMSRLDDEQRADILLQRDQLTQDHIRRLAERLASFHARAAHSDTINSFGSTSSIRRNVVENFQQTQGLNTRFINPEQEREIEDMQIGFLNQHPEVFEQRIQAGKIRDGHGDLRLEHVYLSDKSLNIIDCIEFNERFRFADVCADLSFLAMDLAHLDRSDLAEDLLADYAQFSSDYGLYSVVDFYTGYRAYVRAKIASFLANDEQVSPAARKKAQHDARSYYLHANTAQRLPMTAPIVVAVGGMIASGKSYTSRKLSKLLHCPVVDTDRTRKHLLGVEFESRIDANAFTGAYSPEFSASVYSEVLRRAEIVLASQRTVIIDATFHTKHSREAALKLAAGLGLKFCFIECHVPREIAMKRLREREHRPGISDARTNIYDEFTSLWEPVTEFSSSQLLKLDTSLSDETTRSILINRFDPD